MFRHSAFEMEIWQEWCKLSEFADDFEYSLELYICVCRLCVLSYTDEEWSWMDGWYRANRLAG